jgi:transposase
MSNDTLNSLRKQLTFDFMLDFTVELTYEEVALLTLFENLDYSAFGTKLGRKDKVEPFRMMLLLVHGAMNNRTSSRDLERHVERDLFMKAVFGPDVHVDHSTISRFIARYPEQIEDIFRQSVERLSSLGELGKKVVFQDGTKVESRAGRYTFVWKSYAEKYREKCLARIRKLLEEAVASGLVQTDGKADSEPERLLASAVRTIDEQGLFNPEEKRGRGHHKSRINRLKEKAETELSKLESLERHLSLMDGRNSLSKTDTDATFMRMKEDHMLNGQLKPAYNIQNAVDSNYIVASSISCDRTDYRTAAHILGKLDRLSWKYDIYCADSGYDSLDSHNELEKRNIEAYIKPQDWEISKTRKYQKDCGRSQNMRYVGDGDYFICRNNRKLVFSGERRRKAYAEPLRSYECRWGCMSCPYRKACIRNPKRDRYKKFEILLEHQRRQRIAYEKLSTAFGAEVRANRSIQVEGRFALQKQQFGLRRFSSFGRKRVFSEWLICCMAANTVQLAARIEQEKVGTPFWYRIRPETA